jgi:hypothetical protein
MQASRCPGTCRRHEALSINVLKATNLKMDLLVQICAAATKKPGKSQIYRAFKAYQIW